MNKFACFISLFLLVGCGERSSQSADPAEPADGEQPTVAQKAIEGLQETYDELKGQDIEAPVRWATEDLENIGDWDYKVVEIENLTAMELEETLNKLGDERWQAFWMEKTRGGYRILLKKPSVSYLSKIPLSQLGRFIVPDSGE